MPVITPDYKAPRWVAGAHLQTIVPAKLSKRPQVDYRRERWETPDDDFIDLDWAEGENLSETTPVVLHFHGLEGSSQSHYALAFDGCGRPSWLARRRFAFSQLFGRTQPYDASLSRGRYR